MKISKQDALSWFEFFAMLPEEEELMVKQQEIIYATFAQIEAAINDRNNKLMAEIKGLKSLQNRTLYVGKDNKFSRGCRSCLMGTGLTDVYKRQR